MPDPTTPARERRIGLLCLAVTTVGWGLNWPALKVILESLPPFTARAAPGLTAAALLALAATLRGESLAIPRGRLPRVAITALLNFTLWMGAVALALRWLAAGEGVIVAYTVPLWTALLAWPVLGERPTARHAAALALGLAGIAVLLGGRGLAVGAEKLPGVLLVLAAALSFSLGTVVTKRWPPGLPPIAGTAWQVALGVLPLLALAGLLEHPDPAAIPARGWAAMAFSAAVSFSLSYVTWFAALRRLPAGVATLGTLAAPVLGVAAAALLLHEPLGWREAAALLLTLGGVTLVARR